jgi:TRAP-type C4-dicarboxylate transport system substrate-binding protein
MKRRQLLQATSALAFGAPALVGLAQERVTLRLHTFLPATSNAWTQILKYWMDKVTQESGGQIQFQAYAAMQMGGSPAQLYDQVRDGVADIVWTLPGYTPGRFLRAEAMELPFMTYDAEGASRAAWHYVEQHAGEDFKDVRLLAFAMHGRGVLHSRAKAITAMEHLQGMKVRGPSRLSTKMLTQLGASAVGMPLPQIPDALSKGVIDACALPWDIVTSVKVHELVKHHTEMPASRPALYNSTFAFAMNKARYERLPAPLKAVIDRHSGADLSAYFGRVQQSHDPVARQTAVANGNMVHVMADTEADRFIRATEPVYREWVNEVAARGLDGDKLLAAAREQVARYRPRA